MSYCKALFFTMLILISSQSIAQESILEQKALEDDIRELLIVSNAAKLGDQMLDQIFNAYEKMIPNVPPELWQKARSEMRAEEFTELVIPIYAKHFDRKDIKGIITFYKSPIGKKLIDNQGAMMKESMAIGLEWGKEVSRKIESDLKSKGYKIPNSL